MDLAPKQVAHFRAHLANINARETCPVCDRDEWSLTFVAVAFAPGLIRRICQCCGSVQLFDPRPFGWTTAHEPTGHYTYRGVLVPASVREALREQGLMMG